MIELEFKYSYINGKTSEPFEFTNTVELDSETMESALEEVEALITLVKLISERDGANMDTFHFEYNLLVPEEMTEENI